MKPGSKLGQADVSEIERALGDFVDLPSHGDGLHLQRDDDEEARERVGDEVGMGEGDSPGQARVFGSVSIPYYFATEALPDQLISFVSSAVRSAAHKSSRSSLASLYRRLMSEAT